jgi:GNAT superfamily N-acetyltransferase
LIPQKLLQSMHLTAPEAGPAANFFEKGRRLITALVETSQPMKIRIRQASSADIPFLRELIEASVRGLQTRDYSPSQIDSGLATVYGVDTQLIADGTYFAAHAETEEGETAASGAQPPTATPPIVGCGGWSKRKTLYGGDQWIGREAALLNPPQEAAKIRAFFVHPFWTRRGIGRTILEACERAAVAAGFTRFEMGATSPECRFTRPAVTLRWKISRFRYPTVNSCPSFVWKSAFASRCFLPECDGCGVKLAAIRPKILASAQLARRHQGRTEDDPWRFCRVWRSCRT